jgi:flagellar hook-basal body complex protein FliE
MPVPPIDPSFSTTGPEWSVGSVGPAQGPAQGSGESSFGGMLSNAISGLDQSQTQAAAASQSLATGTAKDPTSVVMQVEQANLAMQLASQIRTKAVEAESDIFHTQV